MGILFQRAVHPLSHGPLAKLLLHLGDPFTVVRQVRVGIFQRVIEMAHQVCLQLPLARIRALPLLGNPVFDDLRAAVLAVFDHAVHPQRHQLLIAARRRDVDRLQGAAGDGGQKAPGQQVQIGFVNPRANRPALIQPHIGQQRPGLTVIAIHRDGVTDLVQRCQQIAPGGIEAGVNVPGAELLASGQNVRSLVTVDGEVVLPQAHRQQTAQRSHAKTCDQQSLLAAGDFDVVTGQPRFGVDHLLEQLLGKIDGLALRRLDLGRWWRQVVGLARLSNERIAQGALLED